MNEVSHFCTKALIFFSLLAKSTDWCFHLRLDLTKVSNVTHFKQTKPASLWFQGLRLHSNEDSLLQSLCTSCISACRLTDKDVWTAERRVRFTSLGLLNCYHLGRHDTLLRSTTGWGHRPRWPAGQCNNRWGNAHAVFPLIPHAEPDVSKKEKCRASHHSILITKCHSAAELGTVSHTHTLTITQHTPVGFLLYLLCFPWFIKVCQFAWEAEMSLN